MTPTVELPALHETDTALLDSRPWALGWCLLCRIHDVPVTTVVSVYQGGTAVPMGKCRGCVGESLRLQRASAEVLHPSLPYCPTLPPHDSHEGDSPT
ncbi:hypothetical protein ACIP9H_33810 [Streptomyces sp. NPDC088732]|uniref:hypothetical protein n=1 Tax=Streptomyces sp. NPDC088732 TaxID=3365879 RepID=UPI003801279B